jgi:L-serine/L-threonine ammonia-lyase
MIEILDDHKMLVELACSTTLVAAYKEELFDHIIPPTGTKRLGLFIVCGGFKVSLDDIVQYRALFDACSDSLEVYCDGEAVKIKK